MNVGQHKRSAAGKFTTKVCPCDGGTAKSVPVGCRDSGATLASRAPNQLLRLPLPSALNKETRLFAGLRSQGSSDLLCL